jgi:hypothetical protein
MAKQGNLKGIMIDPEDYAYSLGFQPWIYNSMVSRHNDTFANYQAEVKLRGQQVMNAMKAIYPDITIMTTFGYSMEYLYSKGGSTPLTANRYGLLGSFLDGMLETADPSFKGLIEGDENSFYMPVPTTDAQYASERNLIRTTYKSVTSDPTLYDAYVQASFGIYLEPINHYTPAGFQSSLTAALDQTDQYVWVYSEGDGLFPVDNTNGGSITPIPQTYVSAMQTVLAQFAQ